MKFSDEFKAVVILIVGVALIFGFGYFWGHMDGYYSGQDAQREYVRKEECWDRYGREQYKYIPGECIRYFNKPQYEY